MQYKVPQNVEIEDKVVGPLTIRQFLILLATAGIILVLNFFLGFMGPVFYMIAIFFGMLGLGLAFFKYGGQNAEIFALSALKTFTIPRRRVWQKEEPEELATEPPIPETPKEEFIPTRGSIVEARSHLERLAEILDSRGYSAISKKAPAPPVNAQDILKRADEADQEMENMLKNATFNTPQREPLVSEIATMSPNQALKKTREV